MTNMDSIFDTDLVLSKLDKTGVNTYFLDFLHTNSFDAGLLRLNPGERDTQRAAFGRRDIFCYRRGRVYSDSGQEPSDKKGFMCFHSIQNKAPFPWKQ